MSTAYHVENIERITEQMLEEEITEDINNIRADAEERIKNIRDDCLPTIEDTKTSAVDTIENTKDEFLSFEAAEKRNLILKLSDTGIRADLKKIDSDTDAIYQKIKTVIPDAEKVIENDIRSMIVDAGYEITFLNDGNGNVTVNLRKVD